MEKETFSMVFKFAKVKKVACAITLNSIDSKLFIIFVSVCLFVLCVWGACEGECVCMCVTKG